jgi:hypothetical protein
LGLGLVLNGLNEYEENIENKISFNNFLHYLTDLTPSQTPITTTTYTILMLKQIDL